MGPCGDRVGSALAPTVWVGGVCFRDLGAGPVAYWRGLEKFRVLEKCEDAVCEDSWGTPVMPHWWTDGITHKLAQFIRKCSYLFELRVCLHTFSAEDMARIAIAVS